MQRRTIYLGTMSAITLLIGAVSCSVSVSPDSATFTLAGQTFRINFRNNGIFELVGGDPPVRQAMVVTLFDETPADDPQGATLSVSTDDITFLPRTQAEAKRISRIRADEQAEPIVYVTFYIASRDNPDPSANGYPVLQLERHRDDTGDYMIINGERHGDISFAFAFQGILEVARQGVFSLCMEVSSNVDGVATIKGVSMTYYDEPPSDDSDNEPGDGGTDDGGTDDGGSDNSNGGSGNSTDNSDGGDGGDSGPSDDTTDPVDARDPDGDGDFEVFACDALDAVVLEPSDPRISGAFDENCIADAVFKNTSDGDIAVYWRIVWENTDRKEEGWESGGVAANGTRQAVVPPFAAQNIVGDQRDVKYIREIAATRLDGEYFEGCAWIGAALREDDMQPRLSDLRRRSTETVRPCE